MRNLLPAATSGRRRRLFTYSAPHVFLYHSSVMSPHRAGVPLRERRIAGSSLLAWPRHRAQPAAPRDPARAVSGDATRRDRRRVGEARAHPGDPARSRAPGHGAAGVGAVRDGCGGLRRARGLERRFDVVLLGGRRPGPAWLTRCRDAVLGAAVADGTSDLPAGWPRRRSCSTAGRRRRARSHVPAARERAGRAARALRPGPVLAARRRPAGALRELDGRRACTRSSVQRGTRRDSR